MRRWHRLCRVRAASSVILCAAVSPARDVAATFQSARDFLPRVLCFCPLTEDRGGFYAIEYLPDPTSDPMDRETVQSDEAGLYRAEDLEPVE